VALLEAASGHQPERRTSPRGASPLQAAAPRGASPLQAAVQSQRVGGSVAVQPVRRSPRGIGGSSRVTAAEGHATQRTYPPISPVGSAVKLNLFKASEDVRATDAQALRCPRSKSEDALGGSSGSVARGAHKQKLSGAPAADVDCTSVSIDLTSPSSVSTRDSGDPTSSPLSMDANSVCDGATIPMDSSNGLQALRSSTAPNSVEGNCDRNLAPESGEACKIPFNTLTSAGYRLVWERELGHGAQGIVKLAQNSAGVQRSVKYVPKTDSEGQKVAELRAEFNHLSRLDSRFVAKAFELFQDHEHCYMIGEPYFGGDFCTLLPRAEEQRVAMVENWWRTLMRQCFEGLAYLHSQGVLHCDIKEPNLMLRRRDLRHPQVVIIDFGLAVNNNGKTKERRRGTMGYIPPETYDTELWNPEGDVFSMGVVIAQLLLYVVPISPSRGSTRCGAFTAGVHTVEEVKQATLTRDLSRCVVEVLPLEYIGLARLLPKIVAKDIKDRFSAQKVLDEPWFSQQNTSSVEFNPRVSKLNRQMRRAKTDPTRPARKSHPQPLHPKEQEQRWIHPVSPTALCFQPVMTQTHVRTIQARFFGGPGLTGPAGLVQTRVQPSPPHTPVQRAPSAEPEMVSL